jgi:hypothetical protein
MIAGMLYVMMLAYASVGLCAAAESQPGPAVFFPEKVFDFGLVLEGKEVTHDFIVRNQGKSELLIQNVKPG